MDCSYLNQPRVVSEIDHRYGDKVHLLTNPYMSSLLAKLGHPDSHQPQLNYYIHAAYSYMLGEAINYCFPMAKAKVDTRMKDVTPYGVYEGDLVLTETPAVVVDLARAGTYPSHLIYEQLNYLLNPKVVRQDHFYLNRKVNEKDEVIGVDVSGSKIGGTQEGALVLFPDPMGATGGSISHCIDHYKKNIEGVAHKYLALHIIITPEYIARMKKDHPDVEIFALRLDRGLSDPEVLASVPGTMLDRECGLTETQYIVPGAGGVGEILNNSFV
jgi:uracil phosphoribosyltransferase